MLYSESRKNGQKGYHQVAALMTVALMSVATACHNNLTPAEVVAQQRLHLLSDVTHSTAR